MASQFDLDELVRPDGIVPVNVETTAGLIREIERLREALGQIVAYCDGSTDPAIVLVATSALHQQTPNPISGDRTE